ncbi:MAG: nicotinate-nucleotide adenylyltransferase [Gammaproteobacteria bacterium]|nr:nicotinate-nucleotide adenylyltransferase [Gammaproteobacteria bacterium]MCW9088194.1 nicotinate-nucleotide adenylyltransferase [Gammaproteobacteria bacterium]
MAQTLPAPVGIFGGTFDPVHFGHLRPALELYEQLSLQQMRLVPCSVPPHRPQPLASVGQRLAMLRLAVSTEPALEIDERELNRSGPSYMVDTLSSLRKELGDTPICLCLGVDAFLGLPGWQRWRELLSLAHIVVAHRPGWQLDKRSVRSELGTLMAQHRQQDVAALRAGPAGTVLLQPVTQLAISATVVRERIGAGRSARYLLPDDVWHYIQQQKLYF